jgi:hypothetical protein
MGWCYREDKASIGQLENVILSKGGRVTLIKSTLANLPTYFLSLFPLFAVRIEKLQRDFLWRIGEEFECYLVSWSKVCTLISEGGMVIRNLVMFNRAMLGNWLWRYEIERDAWWRILVDSKFGSLWAGWCSLEPVGVFGVGLWMNIRKWWDTLFGFARLEVGDGARTILA